MLLQKQFTKNVLSMKLYKEVVVSGNLPIETICIMQLSYYYIWN
jgi:hypothetical protein